MVAHRPAAIAHADRIHFLGGGRVVERGTLPSYRGRYADFWNERSGSGVGGWNGLSDKRFGGAGSGGEAVRAFPGTGV
ncbi:hypothetical protein ACWDT6_05600 [Nocardia grenadensis]|uniref:hypothetical protein n=1 Tax=Nocardia grenadensis TaxID=931537 RepID=UPI003D900F36